MENYFSAEGFNEGAEDSKVRQSTLPPIFLQRPHHSMTIIGIEVNRDGRRNLLIFDPAYRTTYAMAELLVAGELVRRSHALLKPYRKGRREVVMYKSFETLSFA